MPSGNLENQLVTLAILVVGALFGLRLLLGKEIYSAFIARWLFEITRAIVVFPFRIVRFLFERLFVR
jgi:hypothetical protein